MGSRNYFLSGSESVLAPHRGAAAKFVRLSKLIITFYSELGIEQTQWWLKEDLKGFNSISYESTNSFRT